MTITLILSMVSLSFAMSITPGPVNLMIVSSGVNHGFKKTFSFVSGATIGFTLLLIFISFGFIKVISTYPIFLKLLSIFGSIFIIYMGYKIASSNTNQNTNIKREKVLRFHEGFLLQWLNPKAWIACISGISLFSSTNSELYTFIVIYFLICYASLSFWAIFSHKLSSFINNHKRLQVFNLVMGSLLILTACYLLLSQF